MRRLGRLAVAVALVLTVVAAGLWLASRTATVRGWMRARVVASLAAALGADVRVGEVGGTLGRSLVLEDLRVAYGGRTVARVERVEAVYAPLALLRGRLKLRRLTLVGPRLRAVHDADGWRLPHGGGGGRGDALEIRRLLVSGGRVAVALAEARPPRRLALTALALDARLRLDAATREIDVASFHATPRGLSVSPLAAAGRLAVTGSHLEASGVQLASARSRVTLAGTLDAATRVDAHLVLAPLDAGEVRAVLPAATLRTAIDGRLDAVGPWSRVALAARAALGPAGALEGSGHLDLAARRPAWRARARFTALDPGAAVPGFVRAHAFGRAAAGGRGLGAAAPLVWALALAPSSVAGRPLVRAALHGRVQRGVHHAHGELGLPAGTVALHARLVAARVPAYRLAARLALDRVQALAPALPGRLAARAVVDGRGTAPADRHATLRATLAGASLRDVALTGGEARATLAGDTLRLDAAGVDGPGLHASAHGSLDLGRRVAEASLEGSARLDALAVERASVRLDASGLGGPAPTGTARLTATHARLADGAPREVSAQLDWRRLEGVDRVDFAATARADTAAPDRLALTLTRGPNGTAGELRELAIGAGDGPRWTLARPARFELDDGVATQGLTLVAEEQRVAVTGRLRLDGPTDATLEATRVRLAPVCALVERRCAGAFAARVAVTGTAAAPQVSAALTTDGTAFEGVAYGAVRADLAYAERVAVVHATLDHPDAGQLHVDGRVPVDLAWAGPRPDLGGAPIDLAVRAARLDLAFLRVLAAGELRDAAGRVDVDLRVTGPRRAPVADGQVALDGGRLTLAAAGVPYEDLRLRLGVAGGTITVRELHARAGDGRLDGEGQIALAGAAVSAVAVTLHLDRFFAVQRTAYEAAVSGTITMRGTLFAPELTGDLEVERAVVRPAALPATGASVEPDPTITVTGLPAAPPPPEPSPITRLGDPMRLAVGIRIAQNAWIRRADADIELGGEVRLEKAPHEHVRVIGVIRLIRGWYAFQGRRFEIEEGTVRFTGEVPPRPQLDVTATHRTPGYRIVVRVTGSGEKPTLGLSAEPALEQADILAVLLFGKPTQQLGRGESVGLQQQALQLAAGYVMPELRTSVMNSLGLDTLDLAMPQPNEPSERDRAGRVSVGRYVAPDVFVSLGQEFGSRAAQVMSLEYGITPRISARGSTTTRGDGAIDLLWHRRY